MYANKELNHVIIPVKKKYVDKILSGEKYWEFRRVPLKRINVGDVVYIYEAEGRKAVVAVARIDTIFACPRFPSWELFGKGAGATEEEIREYFGELRPVNAYKLTDVKSIEPVTLLLPIYEDGVLFDADPYHPQSARYISYSEAREVEECDTVEYSDYRVLLRRATT